MYLYCGKDQHFDSGKKLMKCFIYGKSKGMTLFNGKKKQDKLFIYGKRN